MLKLTFLLMLNALISFSFAGEHSIKTSDELNWKAGPESLPSGSKVSVLEGDPSKEGPFTLRLQLPANYRIMPHWHPGIEHVTVIDGQFFMGAGDELNEAKASAMDEGGYAVMPPKFHHYAFTKNEGAIIQLHGIGPWDIVYLNPEDDPRIQKKSEKSKR